MIITRVDLSQLFGLLQNGNQTDSTWYFGDPLFPSVSLCYPQIQFKKCDNNPYGSIQITHSYKQMNDSITNGEIISLSTLNILIPVLLYSDWLDTVPVRTRWSGNWSIYRRVSSYFTVVTKSTDTWSFGATLLPLLGIFLMWLSLMFGITLSLRIKYDNGRNKNNCDESNVNHGFLIWSKITTLTFAWYYFYFKSIKFYIFFVLSLRINYYNNKN